MSHKKNDIATARRAIASLARLKYRRRYPAALRARLAAVVRAHPERGLASLAHDLDMAPQTLERIASSTRARLVPVRVLAGSAQRGAGVVVHGPRGITVEGLDVLGVAELIRALS
jgi:hypothetical protein